MRILTVDEIRSIEREAFETLGMKESLIIENVGIKTADLIEDTLLSERSSSEICVVIGKGNNGADGVCLARHLKNHGYSVHVVSIFPNEKKSKELEYQLELAAAFELSVVEVSTTEEFAEFFAGLDNELFVVDAILGTGLKLPLSDYLYEVFELININADQLLSIDIPSGVSADNGEIGQTAIIADYTAAISAPKIGSFLGIGIRYSGEIFVLEVGFPAHLFEGGNMLLLTEDHFPSMMIGRDQYSYKNSFGHLQLLGGSEGLTGALILASESASKVGAGLVTAKTWDSNYFELVSRVSPEIMTATIPKKEGSKFDATVIGPGMGHGKAVRDKLLEVLEHTDAPVVMDADAINAISKKDFELIKKRKQATVMTPHLGEFARLLNVEVKDVKNNLVSLIKEVADSSGAVVILKSCVTFICFPDGDIFVNYAPNAALSTAGSGDVLSGMLGGLLAQDHKSDIMDEKQAICFAVYLHSLIGLEASEHMDERSVSARDLIDCIPEALESCFEEEEL